MHLNLKSEFWNKRTRKLNPFKFPTIEGGDAFFHFLAATFIE
jgi:hypothetical protein